MNQTSVNQPIARPAEYGAPYEGGFYGGVIRIGNTLHDIVVAPKAGGEFRAAWAPTYAAVPSASSTCDSMANTRAMAEAGSEIAQRVLQLAIGGTTGWCIPARDVLELLYRHLKPTRETNACSYRDGDNPCSEPAGLLYTEESPAQTEAEVFQAGGGEAFETRWYWSSTQFSADYAYGQYFYDGNQYYSDKGYEAQVRAVRLIQRSV